MSTAPTSSSAPAASAPAAHTTAPGKPRHAATHQSGGDLFANLLSLLSSTRDPAGDGALGTDTATDPTTDGPSAALNAQDPNASQNPLAALMGWSALPQAPAGNGTAASGGDSARPSSASPLAGATLPAATLTAAAGAGAAAGAASGVSLQGLTPLTTPAAPDADTLAALAEASRTAPAIPAADAASAAVTAGDNTATAPRSLHWRSTAGPASAATPPAVAADGRPALGDSATGTRQAWAAQSRSTVALDDRFGQTLANDTPLAAGGSVPVAAGASGTSQRDSGGSGSPGATPDQALTQPLSDNTAPNSPEAVAYAEATRELDDTGAAHWGGAKLHHASLRVGEGRDDAIDIQLSLKGQEVQVDFRTDNADARASLAQDAGGSLGELLQRSGIQLGSVSVGAQNQPQGEPGRAPLPATPAQSRGRVGAVGSDAPSAPAPVVRPRSDGSRPLDLFV